MNKQLHEASKEELIEVVQDYQEMVSEIEGIINENVKKDRNLLRIREAISKWMHEEDVEFNVGDIVEYWYGEGAEDYVDCKIIGERYIGIYRTFALEPLDKEAHGTAPIYEVDESSVKKKV